MRVHKLFVLGFGIFTTTAAAAPAATSGMGKSYTGWDCCKPACAWSSNLLRTVTGASLVCDINNRPLPTRDGLSAPSDCSLNGTAFLCDTYPTLSAREKVMTVRLSMSGRPSRT
ncbi:hypothetical protein B0T25DRAFT_562690 [Lasiosphaeria hispida]|uniref:cellulase n=1 Tax=Lasiosphaeria hispida TaxID=260671 RepID=A0AAJ0MKG0_9PEZI|nr:hypothetical protein B0T25DRAFT_562690 [Lasiosphaeria hispida]